MVEVGVSGVQQPAVVRLNGDTGVTFGVSVEWNEQDFGRQPLQITNGLEAKPIVAFFGIGAPVGTVGPLRLLVPRSLV